MKRALYSMHKKINLQVFYNENLLEAGCDEAGRGPLAGPVFAAAVILPKDFHNEFLNDSKQMTRKHREMLRPIIEKEAIAWSVVQVSPQYSGYKTIVKGDATYASIAAASVLAKTYRDDLMCKLAIEYPQYGWDQNMGYPTEEHIEAIRKYGLTPYHRKSFHPKELEPSLF